MDCEKSPGLLFSRLFSRSRRLIPQFIQNLRQFFIGRADIEVHGQYWFYDEVPESGEGQPQEQAYGSNEAQQLQSGEAYHQEGSAGQSRGGGLLPGKGGGAFCRAGLLLPGVAHLGVGEVCPPMAGRRCR